jgi:hypothetical protein
LTDSVVETAPKQPTRQWALRAGLTFAPTQAKGVPEIDGSAAGADGVEDHERKIVTRHRVENQGKAAGQV